MKNLMKRIGAYLGASRARKAMVRGLAVLVVFSTTYSLVLPAITKAVNLSGELDGVSVRVEAKSGAIPAETNLLLSRVLLPGDEEPDPEEAGQIRRLTGEEVDLILAAALEGDEESEARIIKALDISLEHNGDEIEPEDAVRLFLKSELIRQANRPAIVHLDDAGTATLLAALSEDGETMIQFGSFEDEPELPEPPEVELDENGNPVAPPETDESGNPVAPPETDESGDPVAPPETDENGDPVAPPEADENGNPVVPPETDENGTPAAPPEADENGNPAVPPETDENGTPAAPPETDENGAPAVPSETDESSDPVASPEEDRGGNSVDPEPAPEPEQAGDASADTSDEISGVTDSFSVYAIVDLTPKAEIPPVETVEFTGSVEDMDVFVTASLTAFPEGTTMQVAMVPVEEVEAAVSEAVAGEIKVVKAVDITFFSAEGEEIEPSEPISVVMKPHEQIAEIANAENDAQLVHIGKEETTVMADAAVGADEVSFESGEFSTYVIVIPLGKPGTQTYEGEGVTITVIYGPEANLPEGTSLVVRELEEGSAEYDEYLAKTESALNLDASVISMEDVSLEAQLAALMGGEQKVEKARFFDITLKHNGEEIEPEAPVTVEIKYNDASEAAEGLQIVHFAEESDGTERPEIITPTVENGTVTYQQSSFSMTAVEVATKYGNGGWWYTNPNNPAKNETYRMRFRYKNGIFELGYPGNFHAAGTKDNADWSWPGDSGYPFKGGAGQLNKGTTIEQILRALAEHGDPTYCSTVTGVDFMMYGTYTVDNDNWKANGSRSLATGYGAQETEVWTGEFHSTWTKPTGAWRQKSISINRVGDFGPLIHIKSSGAHPVHARSNVVINNSGSSQTAVLIENEALLMMEVNAHIIGGPNKAGAVGTGVYLDKGGSVEFFDNSFVTNMNVAVEQKNGKTRLKTSPNPFGEHNGRNVNDGNTTGVALWPGQSIGKWTEALPAGMQAVPILLRDLDQWKSGDIVMDSGRWWYNEIHKNGPHNEMYGAVVSGDLGSNKFYFQNPQDGVNMALEYYSGGKTYTNQTVTNYGGTNQVVAPSEKYPVIRFTRGTVYNTNTNTWYKTLYDAVNNENPMGPGTGRRAQSNDTLVFYGSTVEDRDVVIPGNISDLTIRASKVGEMANDNRSGSACTAQMNASIVINNGATVTIEGGTGGLTLDGNKSSGKDIIENNGTLHIKGGDSTVTLKNAGDAAVQQNSEFHLYSGVFFPGGNSADVKLPDKHVITLETPTEGWSANNWVKIMLEGSQYNGRDVVVPGSGNRDSLSEGDLNMLHVDNLDQYISYVYNATGCDNTGGKVLELKEAGSVTVNVKVIAANDDGTETPIEGAVISMDGVSYSTGKEGFTDSVKYRAAASGKGNIKLTGIPAGYRDSKDNRGTTVYDVVPSGEDFTLDKITDRQDGYTSSGTAHTFTIKLVPKKVGVTLVKVDKNGSPLAGAVFTFNGQDHTSNGDGLICSTELGIGSYELTETKAPDNHQLAGKITVTVALDASGRLVVTKDVDDKLATLTGDEADGYTLKVVNFPSTVKIELIKVEMGNENKTLPGASFTLTGGSQTLTGTTDGNGKIIWSDIQVGTSYSLTETAAPDGYLAAAETMTILLTDSGELQVNGTHIKADSYDSATGVIKVTIQNSPGVRLPSTGGMGTGLYTALGLSLMMAAAVLTLELKRKGRA